MFTRMAEKSGLLDFIAPRKKKEEEKAQINADKELARRLQLEEEAKERSRRQREREERSQIEREIEAEKKGMFVKKQKVLYYHKSNDKKYYAVIVGVHFDDGPDRPYYTIKYQRPDTIVDENGVEHVTGNLEIEKQTTPDRLIRIAREGIGQEISPDGDISATAN
uniref:Uncharacterized protein n=1 Tax=Leptocylindrus danicus TaxID=163516 RepID=A0A7S2JSX7_9STRA|mmetsp:Transcript_10745/g.16137  ORF Transcript_10745/g.16137 Transcript_10745/m.16137 type:complete len:165 (+) Transcript_10745:141-635(+)|eukprot:CAMPEP_0116004184 /NCGR_PEP_ID=MMETSP0321-20121206/461_1 /TAXON_ID=163516 /ORGANISM="Leptocylindrus danicus var. danicus, Strain B650" /LENGTH=164 /DNA_ID=CAMNT_0003472457 /DNA_START=81 /DNA_END=575 /DNA_ORIENTATION=-